MRKRLLLIGVCAVLAVCAFAAAAGSAREEVSPSSTDICTMEMINGDGTTTVIPPNDPAPEWMLTLAGQIETDLSALEAIDGASAYLAETDGGLRLTVMLMGTDPAASQEDWESVIRQAMAEASVETYELQVTDSFGNVLIG